MARRLSKETTDWLDVDYTSNKKLAAAYSKLEKFEAQCAETRNALRAECAAIKNAELVAKGELPADMEPHFSWTNRFTGQPQWRVAVEKTDGSVIGQRRTASGSSRRTI